MKRILFYTLFLISSGYLAAQTPAESMHYARALLRDGQDSLAEKVLRRVVWYDRNTYGVECYATLAAIRQRSGDFAQAEFFYDLLYQNSPADSMRYEALLGKCGALLLQGKYKQSRVELLSLPPTLPAGGEIRKRLYLGATYYGERKFDLAETEWLSMIPPTDTLQRIELRKLIKKAEKIARKSPKKARTMSMLLPGLGQFYAGDWRNGLNSMALNGIMGGWFLYTAIANSIPDAIFSVGTWLFRYYSGGLQKAGIIVEEKKNERLRKNMQNILPLLKRSQKE